MRKQRNPRGLTLLEVLVAMGLVALATLALVSANTFAARASSRSYRRYIAMRLAQERMDAVMLGDTKQRLVTSGLVSKIDMTKKPPDFSDKAPVSDVVLQDCSENGVSTTLCDGSLPNWMGWVDIYGRPCRGDDKTALGYQPTCLFHRLILYTHTITPSNEGDKWNIFVAVSYASDGACKNLPEGNSECVVTAASMTR